MFLYALNEVKGKKHGPQKKPNFGGKQGVAYFPHSKNLKIKVKVWIILAKKSSYKIVVRLVPVNKNIVN